MTDRKLVPHFIQIPKQLLFDESLQPTDKLTYGAILWFSQFSDNLCTASNRRLAEAVNISPKTVQNCLTRLEKKGYIKRVYKTKKKQSRKAVYPQVTYNHGGVSLDEEGGIPNQGGGVSLDEEQRDRSPKGKEVRDKDMRKKQEKWFEFFWERYPKKVDKKKARQKFEKIVDDKETLAEIVNGVEKHKRSTQWQRNGGQYVPYPTTFLNGQRWKDEPQNYESEDYQPQEIKTY